MFASEYVVASFEDVCRAIEGTARPFPLLRVTGALKQRSGTVASMEIEWADASTPNEWHAAEVRIIRVQSGAAPLTEMLLVQRSQDAVTGSRPFLEALVRRVEAAIGPAGRQTLSAGSK